ncbi:hypothetical protein M5K25_000896 [Dendrobium thyrsiflorum]|uniref:Secreted protein n=1 Tax=Dendrobium thyrsiflorum TaxID=117978 RepID=A0ABD0WAX9_DENTH
MKLVFFCPIFASFVNLRKSSTWFCLLNLSIGYHHEHIRESSMYVKSLCLADKLTSRAKQHLRLLNFGSITPYR